MPKVIVLIKRVLFIGKSLELARYPFGLSRMILLHILNLKDYLNHHKYQISGLSAVKFDHWPFSNVSDGLGINSYGRWGRRSITCLCRWVYRS